MSVGLEKTSANGWQADNGVYSYNAGRYMVTITLLTEESGFHYKATDSANNDIYEFTFTNGGGQE